MKIVRFPEEFLQVLSKNNLLRTYLSNLSRGRAFTPRSWLYEELDPQEVLTRWLSKLKELDSGDEFQKRVYQFDTSQLKKWGPQGGVKPIQLLMDDVVKPTFANADLKRPAAFSSSPWELAVRTVVRDLTRAGINSVHPAAYHSVVADMRARDTLFSNSGWPDFARRNMPEVLKAAIRQAENGEWRDFPAIALFRNYHQKTRLVWMFPEATNIVEGSFCQPLQSLMVKRQFPFYMPWTGFESVRSMVTEEYDKGRFLSASDFSSTDAHFGPATVMATFDVLYRLYTRGVATGLRESLQRMYTIPLIIGTDEMLTGKHGVASGSNWTNFVETVFDHVFSEYVRTGTDSNTHGLCAIGDDMCWVSSRFDDALDQKLEQFGKEVGQELNAEKVTNERDWVKFLQRLFQRGYRRPDGQLRGVYSTVRALESSVYPERFHKPRDWNVDMFCARQFMILENCVDHPLFEEFVKYVVHGQRDLIPFACKSAAELRQITRRTKLLSGFNPTYNQEKRDTSLENFESIKLAKAL